MGLALNDNASLRYFKIENCERGLIFFLLLPPLDLDEVEAAARSRQLRRELFQHDNSEKKKEPC